MEYSNIFNYYRGQTKRDADLDIGSKQIENNVKKAFINVLEHSNQLLTLNFIRTFIDSENNSQFFNYSYELVSKLNKKTPKAVVVGIAETNDLNGQISDLINTRPDGAIISDSISILIETKTGTNQLYAPQLEGHKKMFTKGQVVEEQPIFISWSDIKKFFIVQQKFFKSIRDEKTTFLLEQFQQFCSDHSVGYPSKSKEYFYSLFKTPRARELASAIDKYLYEESLYKAEVEDYHLRYNNGVRTDCIGYTSTKGNYKFVTLTMKRKACLVLHLGKVHNTERAKKMQKEIDILLKHNFSDSDGGTPTDGEAYIRLEWVNNLELITPFIDEAYKLRLIK
ncbi:hypothetical protein [Mesobacillus foraminis]|uniref:hypothetical protein n=1 Tax=Mesobacillus foraminis TaxID=279826 RepID=UPI00214CE628|nr:hypothetical protein [Mesobacillus foraminis]